MTAHSAASVCCTVGFLESIYRSFEIHIRFIFLSLFRSVSVAAHAGLMCDGYSSVAVIVCTAIRFR